MHYQFKQLMATSKEGPEMVKQQNETFIEYLDLWKCSVIQHSVFWQMIMAMILMCFNPYTMSSSCCVFLGKIDNQCCNHVINNSNILMEPVARHSYPRTRREISEEDPRFRPKFTQHITLRFCKNRFQNFSCDPTISCSVLNSWEAKLVW